MKIAATITVALLGIGNLFTQEAVPTPSPSPSPRQVPAHVRVFFAIPSDQAPPEFGVAPSYSGVFQMLLAGRSGEPIVLVSNPYPFMVAGYQEVPPGRASLTLSASATGVAANPTELRLAEDTLNLVPGGFYTIVVSGTPERPVITSYDDVQKNAEGKPVRSSIRFLNFLDGVSVEVKSSESVLAAKLPSGTVVDRPNIPSGVFVLETLIQGADGKAQMRRSEINTGESPHLLFTVAMDIYGRIVPFILPTAQAD